MKKWMVCQLLSTLSLSQLDLCDPWVPRHIYIYILIHMSIDKNPSAWLLVLITPFLPN